MKNRLSLLLFCALILSLFLTSCSHRGSNDDSLYYLNSIPDGDTYSVTKLTNLHELKIHDENMIIPAPDKTELFFTINDNNISFKYLESVCGYYGNYSYQYIAESGEKIEIDSSGNVKNYKCGKPINAEGPITIKSEQEIIDIAIKYAMCFYGERFTDYYELSASPDLSEHIIIIRFKMKAITPGYDYGSHAAFYVDADGDLMQVIASNIYKMIDTEVPSYMTEDYIYAKCKSMVTDKNAELEIEPERKLFVINNDIICLAINFRVKGTEKNVTLLFPVK